MDVLMVLVVGVLVVLVGVAVLLFKKHAQIGAALDSAHTKLDAVVTATSAVVKDVTGK